MNEHHLLRRRFAHAGRLVLVVLVIDLIAAQSTLAGDSWPQFRGPGGDGVAVAATPPIEFGESARLTWKTTIPGRGWSSPVVADGVVWVTAAVEDVPAESERQEMLDQSGIEAEEQKSVAIAKAIKLKLIALDLATGDVRRTIDLADVEAPDAIHSLNSYASPTPVVDDANIYCHFGTYGTFCVDRETGDLVWQRTFPLEHSVGPGSSPFIDDNRLILVQDGVDERYVIALDKLTGETIWKTDRPEMDAPNGDLKKSFCTPISVTDSNGRQQLICQGSHWLVSYHPASGSELWRVYHGKGFSVVPRPVFADDVVYFATGFAKPQFWAVRVDGVGDVTDSHVVWTTNKSIPQKPSPLLVDGSVYLVDDHGVASCLDITDGSTVWKERLGGDFSASPILAGGHLYFGNHEGAVFVIRPGDEFELVATNQLDGQIMASPAVVGDALIVRTDQAIYRFD